MRRVDTLDVEINCTVRYLPKATIVSTRWWCSIVMKCDKQLPANWSLRIVGMIDEDRMVDNRIEDMPKGLPRQTKHAFELIGSELLDFEEGGQTSSIGRRAIEISRLRNLN